MEKDRIAFCVESLKLVPLGHMRTGYATAMEAGLSFAVQPLCWRKPKRKSCLGELEISLNPDTEQIHWLCPECEDEGVVTGWRGLIWDMSDSKSGLFH